MSLEIKTADLWEKMKMLVLTTVSVKGLQDIVEQTDVYELWK